MTIYKIDETGLSAVAETSFATVGIYERSNIQQYLLKNIEVLGDRLMVVAEEFSGWLDSSRRIDLLCIDPNANLVVVELKRTDDGGHMDLQSLRYAAMVSAMTFDHLVDAHAHFLKADTNSARAAILEFLEWEDVLEEQFAQDVRIVLAAADFGKELTTSVIWLNERGLDIRCVRLKPYRLEGGPILLDVQQLIPLPEAASFQTQLGAKRRAERESRGDRHSARIAWWTALITRPGAEEHARIAPKASRFHFVRIDGFQWAYLVWQKECCVELFIDLGSEAATQELFEALLAERADLEQRFGATLVWEPVGNSRGAKVIYVLEGGYRTPEDEWDRIQTQQVDAMGRLRAALGPAVKRLREHKGLGKR